MEKQFEITAASIKDDFCNYTYEIIKGVGFGDTHQVKGKGIVDPDMLNAFAKLNVHLAVLDDAFLLSGIEVVNIDLHHTHELATNYAVTGFKVKGEGENKSVVLVGNKYITSASGRIAIETPKIFIGNASTYKWRQELDNAIEKAREEVALYKNGKYTVAETSGDEDPNQSEMSFEPQEEEAANMIESANMYRNGGKAQLWLNRVSGTQITQGQISKLSRMKLSDYDATLKGWVLAGYNLHEEKNSHLLVHFRMLLSYSHNSKKLGKKIKDLVVHWLRRSISKICTSTAHWPILALIYCGSCSGRLESATTDVI